MVKKTLFLIRQSNVKGETNTFYRLVTCTVRCLEHFWVFFGCNFADLQQLATFFCPNRAKSEQIKAPLSSTYAHLDFTVH